MKTTYLNTDTIETMFNQLRLSFGGSVVKESKECILEIKNEIGAGKIRGISLSGGVSYIEFDMTFSDDITISINTPEKNPIYFAYCSQGSLTHSFGARRKKNVLKSFQTGIITSQLDDENTLYFRKNEHLNVTLITVQTTSRTKNSKKEGLKSKLYNTFIKKDNIENFVYIGSQNLKIAEKIQQINAIKQDGLVRTLLIQGLVHIILALEIQQHTDDVNNLETSTGSLTTREMETIKQASMYIEQNFDKQISITLLCTKFGISPSKLQEGFKLMYGRTVTDHIRTIRVQKAEDYLKNTDMNISEVVYSIGFSSRSYFSKIFRETYNCTPIEYKTAQKVLPISA